VIIPHMGEEAVRHAAEEAAPLDESRLRLLLHATSEVARTVGEQTRLEPVAEAIADQAQALVAARSALLLIDDGGMLTVAAVRGGNADHREARHPADGSAWRYVMSERLPERLPEIPVRLATAVAELGIDARSALLVPLVARNRALGLIAVFDRENGTAFRADDEELLGGFAASAAMAVATVQSVVEVRLRESIEVSERERAHWARELHDETLQGLGALRVRLAAALRRNEPAQLPAVVDAAVLQVEDEIANLRSLITELRPAALDELGLEAAIESLAENHAATGDLEVVIDVRLADGDGPARPRDRELESAVYRVIQEALTNVVKHAQAERAWVEVREENDGIVLAVRDDGVGFNMDDRGSGFGLIGMRERVALRGGSLTIVSGPGAGTELRGRIPL
jgi:signal transduction histidine kinase